MIPQRYAKSLLIAAKETGNIPKILEDIKKLESVLKDESVRRAFISPTISRKEKLKLIESISKDLDLLDITSNFLKLLVIKRRIELIDEIILYFYSYYYKDQKLEKITLFSADELNEEEIKTIEEKLKKMLGKKFEIQVKRDESLLLGMEIVGFDWKISFSARDILNKFAKIEV